MQFPSLKVKIILYTYATMSIKGFSAMLLCWRQKALMLPTLKRVGRAAVDVLYLAASRPVCYLF